MSTDRPDTPHSQAAFARLPLIDGRRTIVGYELVLDVLLERGGELAPYLDLTEAREGADDAGFARAAETLQLSTHQVNMAHLDALVWAEELMAG